MNDCKTFWRITLEDKVILINPELVVSVQFHTNINDDELEGVVIFSSNFVCKVTKNAWRKMEIIKLEC